MEMVRSVAIHRLDGCLGLRMATTMQSFLSTHTHNVQIPIGAVGHDSAEARAGESGCGVHLRGKRHCD